jgi:hypothetical protein
MPTGGQSGDWYDTAVICRTGHVLNATAGDRPWDYVNYCTICGAETICGCEECDYLIRGYHHIPGVVGPYTRPSFCHHCGKPYPWTEKALEAAKELADELDISDQEKAQIRQDVEDIVRDTPRTQAAANRFKRIVGALGPVWDEFKDILAETASRTAVKILYGG